jgi:putative tryptophan/tyrosine transport system substrate-binding protein
MKISATMLKRILGVLVVLVVAAAASLVRPAGAVEARQYRVMMVLWRGCEDACRGFQDYLRSRNLPVEFLMRDVKQDPSAFPTLVAEARALHVDLVVTWGTTVTLGIVGTYDKPNPSVNLTDIPVLFMIVTDPVDAHVVASLDKPGRNVSGTLFLVPENVQLRAIRSYAPFKKIGMIYNTNEVNAVQSADKLTATAKEQGFEVVTRTVPNGPDGRPLADSLPGLVGELAGAGVDLIYIGSSSFILLQRDAFTNAALEHKLPVAAAGEVAVVESNALMGLVSKYYDVGRLTATRAEEILVDHKKPADIPVESLSRFSLIVNMEVAKKLELYPPMSLLNIVDVVKTKEVPQN